MKIVNLICLPMRPLIAQNFFSPRPEGRRAREIFDRIDITGRIGVAVVSANDQTIFAAFARDVRQDVAVLAADMPYSRATLSDRGRQGS
jgi:hypothetical protein